MSHEPRWTDDEVATLRKLHAEGLAHSQIGRLMRRSRTSVGSKLDRLGLLNRDRERSGSLQAISTAAANSARRKPPVGLPKLREVKTSTEPRPWTARERGECAWPVAGEGADTLSCCAPTNGLMYCPDHQKLKLSSMPRYGVFAGTGNELARQLRKFVA